MSSPTETPPPPDGTTFPGGAAAAAAALGSLEGQVSSDVKTYLGRLIDEVWRILADGKGQFPNPVFALGTLLGWYVDDVVDPLVAKIEAMWDMTFPVNAARAQHIAAVRDRLSRDMEPEIPEGAMDAVRESQSLAATQGWTPQEMARDIAERLSWEPDKTYWKQQQADIEAEIDSILDPLGPPGTPARTEVHKHDPRIKELQRLRAEAVRAIRADQSVWEQRAKAIARTEFNGMQNAGALAALVAEGVTYKRWLAARDGRTRETHREANGQTVDILGGFNVGGFIMTMPGDPTAPPQETVNCRCTIVGATEAEYHRSLLTASAAERGGNIIVAGIPAPDDPINEASSEKQAHITMLFFGPAEGADLVAIKDTLARVSAAASGAVTLPVLDRDVLGDDKADVLHVDPGSLKDIREALLADPAVRAAHDAVKQYPEWTPHVTLGYPETPALAEPPQEIVIDRLALWVKDSAGPEYILGADADDLEALLAASTPEKKPWELQVRVPKGNKELSGRWIDMPGKVLSQMFDEEALSYYDAEDREALNLAVWNARDWDPATVGAEVFLERADAHLERVKRDKDPAVAEARKYIDDFITSMDWSLFSDADREQPEDIGYDDENDWEDDPYEDDQEDEVSDDPMELYRQALDNAGSDRPTAHPQSIQRAIEMGYDDEMRAGAVAAAAILWTNTLNDSVASDGVVLELSSISDSEYDARTTFDWKIFDGDLGDTIGTLTRWVSADGEVHHDYFQMTPKFQGKGIAHRMNEAALEMYAENGFSYVTLDANIDVGGYAWAKQGFELDWENDETPEYVSNVLDRLAAKLPIPEKAIAPGGPVTKRYEAHNFVEIAGQSLRETGEWPTDWRLQNAFEAMEEIGSPIDRDAIEADMPDGVDPDEWLAQMILQMLLREFGGNADAYTRYLELCLEGYNGTLSIWDIASFGQGDPSMETKIVTEQWSSDGTQLSREERITWPGRQALLGSRWPGRKDI